LLVPSMRAEPYASAIMKKGSTCLPPSASQSLPMPVR
jgi:hypothetical protein